MNNWLVRLVCLALLCPSPGAQAAPITIKRSTGAILAQIEFRDVTVGNTLQVLSNESGLNIIASKEAASIPVTMFLRNVTAMQVIDALAKTYNLWYQRDPESGIVRLYTVKEYRLEQVEYKHEETEIFTLKNAKNALDLAETIQNLFSSRVRLSYGRSQSELYTDLIQRFNRFDYVDRRTVQRFSASGTSTGGNGGVNTGTNGSTGVGGNTSNLNMGGNIGMGNMGMGGGFGSMGGFGTNGNTGNQGNGQDQNNQQQLDQTLNAISNVLGKMNSTQQQGGQNGANLSRQLSGDAEDTRELVDTSVRQQAPIFVGVIKHQNRVLVRTRDIDAMNEIRDIYKRIDVESSMLLMEVKILSIDLSDGFNSLFDINMTNGSAQTSTLSQAANISQNANGGTSLGNTLNSAAQAALQTGATAFNPSLLTTVVSKNFEASLQLLQQQNRVTELATPILLTSNQEVSRFFVGSDQPVITGWSSGSVQTTGGITNNTITVTPQPTYVNREVGNTLLLTPNINADNTVNIQVLVEQSKILPKGGNILVNEGASVETVPIDIVNEQTFSGSVIARDNNTVAVGGLIQESSGNNQSQVPILGDIPILGFFFGNTGKTRSRSELVVIIRPHIITSLQEAQRISETMMKKNSVHPNAKDAGSLDVYSNPDHDPAGYKLEQPFKEFINQDSLDRYNGQAPNPLR